jgi:hypothetical protein
MGFIDGNGLRQLWSDLKERLGHRMPVAPQDGEVHGATGDMWYVLDIAKHAVILVSEALAVTEAEGVITIQQSDFDRLDEFTVEYSGARVVFAKGSPVNVLYSVGENRTLYKFEFDEPNRTITLSDMGRLALDSDTDNWIPKPPTSATAILQSVNGELQWVTMPALLGVDKEQ